MTQIHDIEAPTTEELRAIAAAGYEWVRAIVYIPLDELIALDGIEGMNEYVDDYLGVVLTDITYQVAYLDTFDEPLPYYGDTVCIAVVGRITDALEDLEN